MTKTRGEDAARFAPGTEVQSPFGKGVVRDARNSGRVLVEVHGRTVLMEARTLTPLVAGERPTGRRALPLAEGATDGTIGSTPGGAGRPHHVREVDLHGLTVEEALVRIDHVLDSAIRDDVPELRVIHGRSGGRLRAALHRRLKAIPTVRAFGLDPRNEGVTVVRL